MQELHYCPPASDTCCNSSGTVKDADPAIAWLIQFAAAQGLLLFGILKDLKVVDQDATRGVAEAYCTARQVEPQSTQSLLLGSVPPSQMVLPSQPVDPYQSRDIHHNSILGAIRRLRRRDVFHQVPLAAPAVEPQPIEVPEDPDKGWLSLRPPREPQKE